MTVTIFVHNQRDFYDHLWFDLAKVFQKKFGTTDFELKSAKSESEIFDNDDDNDEFELDELLFEFAICLFFNKILNASSRLEQSATVATSLVASFLRKLRNAASL